MGTIPRFAGYVFGWLLMFMIIYPSVMTPREMCMIQGRWGGVGDDRFSKVPTTVSHFDPNTEWFSTSMSEFA